MSSMILDVQNVSLLDIDILQNQLKYEFKLIENFKIQEASLKLKVGDQVRVDWNGVISGNYKHIYMNNTTLYKYGVITKVKKVNCDVHFDNGNHFTVPIKFIEKYNLSLVDTDKTFECPICYENTFSNCFEYPCGHKICISCSEKWTSHNYISNKTDHCSLCRGDA